ncbi:MAG: class I SAM-dependent methyltransferase [Armatimonadetes bacterium]|nr:class I SAM-dependent methyltransferase [Armatimonadota bacterium]
MTNDALLRQPADALPAFLASAEKLGMWSTARRLGHYGSSLYADVPLRGKRMLDIGGGNGVFSLYAAASGAARVICLEPETDGSSAGMRETFSRVALDIGAPNVEMRPCFMEEFSAEPSSFDVVLIHNSINHFDEPACIAFQKDPAARAKYRSMFETIDHWLAPGGHLLLADCSSRSLYSALGVRNPFMPDIEWHKHQPPEAWEGLLNQLGYSRCCLRWTSPNTFGKLGVALLSNRLGGYVTLGHFRLHMVKAAAGARA